jgi:hypothetical protein
MTRNTLAAIVCLCLPFVGCHGETSVSDNDSTSSSDTGSEDWEAGTGGAPCTDAEECADSDLLSSDYLDMECDLDGGTCTDPNSGLVWQNPPPEEYSGGSVAMDYCASLTLGNRTDWRMPTISELRTLARGCGSCDGCEKFKGPAANGLYWDDSLILAGDYPGYWSSTPYCKNGKTTSNGWLFAYSVASAYTNYIQDAYPIRCVSGSER